MIRTALATAALLLATSGVASAGPADYLIWDSDPDAHPTQGRSGDWSPPQLFSVWQHPDNMIRVKGEGSGPKDYLQIDLIRHDGQRITEGHYVDQRVLVVNEGLGWYDDGAEFAVEHIAYDAEGQISEFEGAVEHHYLDRPNSTFRAKISYTR